MSVSFNRMVVLALLSDGPAGGYDLVKRFDAGISHFWHMTHAQIYSELPKLSEEGFATSKQTGKRMEYTISDLGKTQLSQWLKDEPLVPAKIHHPLLLKLFFGSNLPKEDLLPLVIEAQTLAKDRLIIYKFILEKISMDMPRALTLDFGIMRLEAELDWLEKVSHWLDSPLYSEQA